MNINKKKRSKYNNNGEKMQPIDKSTINAEITGNNRILIHTHYLKRAARDQQKRREKKNRNKNWKKINVYIKTLNEICTQLIVMHL